MAFEITVGPPHLSVNSGWAVLTCEPDCSLGDSLAGPGDQGLYWRDTRLLSGWRIRANGVSWTLLNSAAVEHYATQAYLTNQSSPAGEGEVSARTIGLAVGRTIGAGGMHEDLDLANHGRGSTSPDSTRSGASPNHGEDRALAGGRGEGKPRHGQARADLTRGHGKGSSLAMVG